MYLVLACSHGSLCVSPQHFLFLAEAVTLSPTISTLLGSKSNHTRVKVLVANLITRVSSDIYYNLYNLNLIVAYCAHLGL